ncbi:hypothetical protein O9K51_04024 [Purpureocillium lavendulum]|uniref:Uncharacterized protein n=1 Tax=Purpureocillium lavendulum TaxID=1247861 RepID=A0AB34FVD8_9HYPO|nr:hypothetical protein O9K51_04024 [Purpureocillium lavendulum]
MAAPLVDDDSVRDDTSPSPQVSKLTGELRRVRTYRYSMTISTARYGVELVEMCKGSGDEA